MNNSIHNGKAIQADDRLSIDWCVDLSKKFRDELGGVGAGALQAHAEIGHVTILRAEGQNLACFVTKPGNTADARLFPIIAAAVPTDLQRLHVGMSLLDALDARFKLERWRAYQAICRQDLPSNRFWAAAGFQPIAVRHSSSVRGKPCIIWRRRVDRGVLGVDSIVAEARARMGGGRFLPQNRPDLANIYDQRHEAIEEALRCSGAEPITERWASTDWKVAPAERVLPVIRPRRPNDLQMGLFDPAGLTAECFRR